MDLHQHSATLLERLSNSIYDRLGHDAPISNFTITEIHIVERWLKEVLKEAFSEVTENASS